MKEIKNFRFKNWAGNQRSEPSNYFQPESEAEIISIVNRATTESKKVRVVGGAHSWSAVACTDDFMINLDQLNKLVSIDQQQKQVTAEAGIRLKDLNKLLNKKGLALSNLGSVSEQSIAGAITTGTHGSSARCGILSTMIIGMRVVQADGKVIDISPDLLPYYGVSLGTLGIISSVTIQCTAAFNLELEEHPLPFDKVAGQIPKLLQENEFLKFWWFPHGDNIQVYRLNKTEKPAEKVNTLIRWLEEVALAQWFFTLILKIGVLFPALIPSINRFAANLHFKTNKKVRVSHELFNVPMPPIHRESEYAIPIERTGEALRDMRNMIFEHDLKVNFVLEVRFVKADDILLSPAYKRDSCYIGAYACGAQLWQPYFTLFEELMRKYAGRPHWGKEFTLVQKDLTALYPKLEAFNDYRKKVDPNDIFFNPLMQRVFE